jgi:hypothetical protein
MSGLYQTPEVDSSHVSPTDAAVTMRSLRRRFTAILVPPGDDDRPDDVVHRRPADGGLSAVEHAAWVAQALPELGEALRLVLIGANPFVDVPRLDPDPPVEGGSDPAADVAARVGTTAEPVAEAIDNVPGGDWVRTGRAGGATVTALDLAQGAVELSIHHLRAAERTVTQVLQESR